MNLEIFLTRSQREFRSEITQSMPNTLKKNILSLGSEYESVANLSLDNYEEVLLRIYRKLVILLNNLNVDISDRISFDLELDGDINVSNIILDKYSRNYVIRVGELSKAAEALDHVEDYPSRRVFENIGIEMLEDVLSLYKDCGISYEDILGS